MLRTAKALLICFGIGALLGGCNTVRGIGQDLKAAGQAVEQSAASNKTY